NVQGITFSFPANADLFGNSMSNKPSEHSMTEGMPSTSTVDDMRMRLGLQERRAYDAERLAAATGAISASLDVSGTLEKVAEQLTYVLRLECAAVCLFSEIDTGGSVHMWSKQKPLRSETFSTLEAWLGRIEAVSLVRERGEPVIID